MRVEERLREDHRVGSTPGCGHGKCQVRFLAGATAGLRHLLPLEVAGGGGRPGIATPGCASQDIFRPPA